MTQHVTPAQIRNAKDAADRSAPYKVIARLGAAPPQIPARLYRRLGVTRLPATSLAVFGVIRQAARCKDNRGRRYIGAHVTGAQLARLTGRSERACWYAMRSLRQLGLVRVVPQYAEGEWWDRNGKRHEKRRLANVIVMGPEAHGPAERRARRKLARTATAWGGRYHRKRRELGEEAERERRRACFSPALQKLHSNGVSINTTGARSAAPPPLDSTLGEWLSLCPGIATAVGVQEEPPNGGGLHEPSGSAAVAFGSQGKADE